MTTYNGWKNYETWNVALWLGNDEGLCHAAQRLAQSIKGRVSAAAARDFVEEYMPNGTPDFHGDAGRYARVQWGAIAETIQEWR